MDVNIIEPTHHTINAAELNITSLEHLLSHVRSNPRFHLGDLLTVYMGPPHPAEYNFQVVKGVFPVQYDTDSETSDVEDNEIVGGRKKRNYTKNHHKIRKKATNKTRRKKRNYK